MDISLPRGYVRAAERATCRPIRFGGLFQLDPDARRVFCGADDIHLRPKAFAVLHYLLQRPDRLVTKRELLDAVWPAARVSDAVLKVCVAEIRKALEQQPGGGALIETRHRRGYRFVGSIEDYS